jgi:type VI secretion system secreted protein Hcp
MKNIIGKIIFAVGAVLIFASTAQAAGNYYLQIDRVRGDVASSKQYNEWIKVTGWSWDVTQSGSFHLGGGGTGKASIGDLSLSKFVDISSPVFLMAVLSGKHFDKATLVVTKQLQSGDEVEDFRIEMSKVLISSINGNGNSKVTGKESIALNFAQVCMTVPPSGTEGGIQTCWDIEANTGL